MTRYIDADALKDKAFAEGAYGYVSVYEIDDVPAADVAPVVYATWNTDNPKITPRCTNCRTPNCIQRSKMVPRKQFPPFCPNCGAKMDG